MTLLMLFTAMKKLVAAREVFDKLPPDSIDVIINTWYQQVRDALSKSNEPPHDKTNKMACVPSEDSDQPGHALSLIRVFSVHMKAWVLSYPLNAQRRLISLGGCPD